jgi:hypothetical protein
MREMFELKPLEVATLLVNLHMAAQHPLIGHGDHLMSLEKLTMALNRGKLKIDKDVLESALWASNMLSELGEMWTPYIDPPRVKNMSTFDRFVSNLKFPWLYRFDKFFNILVKKGS